MGPVVRIRWQRLMRADVALRSFTPACYSPALLLLLLLLLPLLQTGAPPENYVHFFELWSIAPVFSSGWSLLGEVRSASHPLPVARLL